MKPWPKILAGLALAILAVIVGRWPEPQQQVPGPSGKPLPELNVVIAARDIDYCGPATPCGPGRRTDTILFVRLVGSRAWVIAVPRDTMVRVEGYQGKVNAAFGFLGPDGLERAVSELVGFRVDRHMIFTLDLVARVVDMVGGIDVTLPAPMDYDDNAANLHIHFPKGRVHLNGADAVKYMRFRGWEGSDLGRLDRIKEVMLKVLKKVASPEYWPRLPQMAGAVWNDLETDLSLGQALVFLPYLRSLELKTATLPVIEDGPYLEVDTLRRARFQRALFGLGQGEVVALPKARVMVLDGSGADLGPRFVEGLRRLGLPPPELRRIGVREVSQVEVAGALEAGAVYAEATHLPLVTRFRLHVPADVVIVLGRDLVQ